MFALKYVLSMFCHFQNGFLIFSSANIKEVRAFGPDQDIANGMLAGYVIVNEHYIMLRWHWQCII